MKKKIALLMSVVFALSVLTGCSSLSVESRDVSAYVTLGEYKGVEVTVPSTEPTEAEVDELAEYYYQSLSSGENGAVMDRAVEMGDTAVIDYEGKLDGVAFEGGTASASALEIGSGSFIAGFEEGLVGVKPGETVDLNLTFPLNYSAENLAGEDVVFTVTVLYIMPTAKDMTDEVVANFNSKLFSTVAELRQYATDRLVKEKEQQQTTNIQAAVLNTVVNNATVIDYAEEDIQFSTEQINKTYTSFASAYGTTVEDIIYELTGSGIEALAEKYTAQTYVVQAIANAENLNLTLDELKENLKADAEAAGLKEKEYLEKNGETAYKQNLLTKKVLNFLVENAVVVYE